MRFPLSTHFSNYFSSGIHSALLCFIVEWLFINDFKAFLFCHNRKQSSTFFQILINIIFAIESPLVSQNTEWTFTVECECWHLSLSWVQINIELYRIDFINSLFCLKNFPFLAFKNFRLSEFHLSLSADGLSSQIELPTTLNSTEPFPAMCLSLGTEQVQGKKLTTSLKQPFWGAASWSFSFQSFKLLQQQLFSAPQYK
jgi:hypothetical protein